MESLGEGIITYTKSGPITGFYDNDDTILHMYPGKNKHGKLISYIKDGEYEGMVDKNGLYYSVTADENFKQLEYDKYIILPSRVGHARRSHGIMCRQQVLVHAKISEDKWTWMCLEFQDMSPIVDSEQHTVRHICDFDWVDMFPNQSGGEYKYVVCAWMAQKAIHLVLVNFPKHGDPYIGAENGLGDEPCGEWIVQEKNKMNNRDLFFYEYDNNNIIIKFNKYNGRGSVASAWNTLALKTDGMIFAFPATIKMNSGKKEIYNISGVPFTEKESNKTKVRFVKHKTK